LKKKDLLQYIWGFESLNEPVAKSDSDKAFLKEFTTKVVNTIIAPKLKKHHVVVLQPGPANTLVKEFENYVLHSNITYIFDLHEYIIFDKELDLVPFGSIYPKVKKLASSDFGITKYPYFVGEWALDTSDCGMYVNGPNAGGFDPYYYEKEHKFHSSFFCNDNVQMRNGSNEGFQTCSSITKTKQSFPGCSVNATTEESFNTYKSHLCSLFQQYLDAFASNKKNIGFAFWTFQTTGFGYGNKERRIHQFDFGWLVNENVLSDLSKPLKCN